MERQVVEVLRAQFVLFGLRKERVVDGLQLRGGGSPLFSGNVGSSLGRISWPTAGKFKLTISLIADCLAF